MPNCAIQNLSDFKIKKFEKEIRRYLRKIPEPFFEYNNETISGSTFHAYLFRDLIDIRYKDLEIHDFPIEHILIYSRMLTLRNLKNDIYTPLFEDEYEDFMQIVSDYSCVILHIYDKKFLHKPSNPFCEIFCAVNKNKPAIVPMSFSINIGEFYPRWFVDKLEKHEKVEVGIDFKLLEKVKIAMR